MSSGQALKYEVRDDLLYTKEHEWAKILNETRVLVGITDYAAKLLHEVVYVSLAIVNSEVNHMQSLGTVESVKAVSDIFSPISGKVVKINEKLATHPELVNNSPYDVGWLVEIDAKNLLAEKGKLMSAKEYSSFIEKL
ncbi:MAG: glycine cleavage system protein GcvH [Thaumarchaeota archaeon]|nr:glycine cleavage system protein GcvH [Nitrososphaerota archaeon]